MNLKISIFADAVGRGKTTFLKKWLTNQKGIGGVLSPKINDNRVFEFIPSGDILDMESKDSAALQVGKYNFSPNHFAEAERRIWTDWQNPEIHTLIIDEIGPLEIKKNQGFHNLLTQMLVSELSHNKRLILVVRDYCLQDFFAKYPVYKARVITQANVMESNFEYPVGIVLCGGNSSRMQTDKAMLNYHSMPQWQYVYNLLLPFCEKVYLSLNANQVADYSLPENISFIEDLPQYAHHGPLTGVLSAMDKVKGKPLFITACDYPLLRMEQLFCLFKNRKRGHTLVCYRNEEFPEPLISIYEEPALSALFQYFADGKDSLAKFILGMKTLYIDVSNPDFLKNANSQEDFESIKTRLGND